MIPGPHHPRAPARGQDLRAGPALRRLRVRRPAVRPARRSRGGPADLRGGPGSELGHRPRAAGRPDDRGAARPVPHPLRGRTCGGPCRFRLEGHDRRAARRIAAVRDGRRGALDVPAQPDRLLRPPPHPRVRGGPLPPDSRRRHDARGRVPAARRAPEPVPRADRAVARGVARASGRSSGSRETCSRPRTSATGSTARSRPSARLCGCRSPSRSRPAPGSARRSR